MCYSLKPMPLLDLLKVKEAQKMEARSWTVTKGILHGVDVYLKFSISVLQFVLDFNLSFSVYSHCFSWSKIGKNKINTMNFCPWGI